MSKLVNMGLIPDIKDDVGNWRKTICQSNMFWTTLSCQRWYDINKRCKSGGHVQSRIPTYTGCQNYFSSFQEFVEWSRKQIGYDIEDSHLDKDLLFKGNKIYGPDTCVFLPRRVNNLLTKMNSKRGDYPIGVYLDKEKSKFKSQCHDGTGVQKHLGYFYTPEEAFYSYKEFKENLMKKVAEEYKDVIDTRAYQALISYQVEIND